MFFSLSVLNLEDHLGLVIRLNPRCHGLHHPAGMPQVTAAPGSPPSHPVGLLGFSS